MLGQAFSLKKFSTRDQVFLMSFQSVREGIFGMGTIVTFCNGSGMGREWVIFNVRSRKVLLYFPRKVPIIMENSFYG